MSRNFLYNPNPSGLLLTALEQVRQAFVANFFLLIDLDRYFLQKVTPRDAKPRISRTKGHLSKRTAFVREIVKEVAGYVHTASAFRKKRRRRGEEGE